jgi:signal transduction histidine kinase
MRRGLSVVGVALAVALLLGTYVLYTQHVVMELRREASRSARMYARVYGGLNDSTTDNGTATLWDLALHIRDSGVPVVLTDADGRPTAAENTPFDSLLRDPELRDSVAGDPRLASYVASLDLQNPPVVEPGIGTVHFGNTPLVQGLRIIPVLQAGMLAFFVFAGIYALRVRDRAERERVWAGMARESAHQLGTPLSSLSGWIELLREREDDPLTATALSHMTADLERLERVAHRFERIGRPPRQEPVDVGALVERVAAYFRARVPTLAHTISIAHTRPSEPLEVSGDAVLLEWAVEALVRNAVDALAGRGGRILIGAKRLPEGVVRIRVADDGPGIPRELRSRIFHAGFSTKESGWGIGLTLAKRIVEGTHNGRLQLKPTSRGATFEIILS